MTANEISRTNGSPGLCNRISETFSFQVAQEWFNYAFRKAPIRYRVREAEPTFITFGHPPRNRPRTRPALPVFLVRFLDRRCSSYPRLQKPSTPKTSHTASKWTPSPSRIPSSANPSSVTFSWRCASSPAQQVPPRSSAARHRRSPTQSNRKPAPHLCPLHRFQHVVVVPTTRQILAAFAHEPSHYQRQTSTPSHDNTPLNHRKMNKKQIK